MNGQLQVESTLIDVQGNFQQPIPEFVEKKAYNYTEGNKNKFIIQPGQTVLVDLNTMLGPNNNIFRLDAISDKFLRVNINSSAQTIGMYDRLVLTFDPQNYSLPNDTLTSISFTNPGALIATVTILTTGNG